jgi:hypothetical protein
VSICSAATRIVAISSALIGAWGLACGAPNRESSSEVIQVSNAMGGAKARKHPPSKADTSTVKKIACGDARCFAGSQHCCAQVNDIYENGRLCVDAQRECDPGWTAIDCDDESDCAPNLRCCAMGSGVRPAQTCMTRCLDVELCVPGATCRGAGQLCANDSDYFSRGVCVTDHPLRECGAEHCVAPRDQCCWSPASSSGRCAARDLRDPAGTCRKTEVPLSCGGSRDCGEGFACCWSESTGASCRGLCTSGVELCRDVGECQGQPGVAKACNRGSSSHRVPSSVGSCVWEDP